MCLRNLHVLFTKNYLCVYYIRLFAGNKYIFTETARQQSAA